MGQRRTERRGVGKRHDEGERKGGTRGGEREGNEAI